MLTQGLDVLDEAVAAVGGGVLGDRGPAGAAQVQDDQPAVRGQTAEVTEVGGVRRAAGIGLSSSGGCSNRNNATCTSLEQVNAATISDVSTLRNASHCALTITGGTEVGHASGTYSHWNGYKIDFSPTSCASAYVTNSFTRIADRGDGAARYRSAAGNVYARESNHWDVTFCGGSAACTSAAGS
ncbi:hypothetical protein [Streptomyces sp. BF23-19]|uniref:hypothetical protein n=1 Tax=unclassified Streptomyces TaxID=2593676 RepID=UPI0034E5AA9D